MKTLKTKWKTHMIETPISWKNGISPANSPVKTAPCPEFSTPKIVRINPPRIVHRCVSHYIDISAPSTGSCWSRNHETPYNRRNHGNSIEKQHHARITAPPEAWTLVSGLAVMTTALFDIRSAISLEEMQYERDGLRDIAQTLYSLWTKRTLCSFSHYSTVLPIIPQTAIIRNLTQSI